MRRKAVAKAAGLAIAATLGVTPLATRPAHAAPKAAATPKGPEAAAKLKAAGDEYQRAGNTEAALREYTRALEADPTHAPTMQEFGRTLFAKGDFAKAAAQFKKAAEAAPDNPVAWYNLGYALRKQGDYPAATQAYLEYVKSNPTDPDGYYSLAECYRARGMRDEAIAQYDLYTQKETRAYEQVWIEKAKARVEALRGNQPIATAASLAAHTPPAAAPAVVEVAAVAPVPAPAPAPAPVVVAAVAPAPTPVVVAAVPAPAPAPAPVVAAPAPEPVAAAAPAPVAAPAPAAASALPTRDPTAAIMKIREGDELFKQKRYKEALFGYQDAIRLDDQSVNAYLKMGLAYANMNFYREAVENWEKVLKLDPANKYAPGYIERAKPYLGGSAPAPVSDTPKPLAAAAPLGAAPVPATAAAAAPPAANVSAEAVAASKEEYRKAVQLINAGRFAESLAPLNAALAQNPGFVNAYVARAGAYLGMRSYNESVADYQKSLAMSPQLATPLYGLGRAYEKLGEKAKAIEFYRRYANSSAPDANAALKRQADQAADNLAR